MVDLNMLGGHLGAALASEPQKAAVAQTAVEQIKQGIDALRALGLTYFLAEGAGSSPVEFPKALYRGDDFEVALTGEEEAALRAVGYDIHPTLRAAPAVPSAAPEATRLPSAADDAQPMLPLE